jgi:hypothetical protein
MYQNGALWSSLTLAENVSLPLEEQRRLSSAERRELASLKLALVGLAGFEDYYPSEISGGMRKRVGIARALALDVIRAWRDRGCPEPEPVTPELLKRMMDWLGALGVNLYKPLAATFSEALDPSTVNSTTFTLINADGAVSATVGYDNSARTATLTPDVSLSPVKRYTATIPFDRRLAPFDIQGSLAHAAMLHKAGVLSEQDLADIRRGLEEILSAFEAGDFPWSRVSEDVF